MTVQIASCWVVALCLFLTAIPSALSQEIDDTEPPEPGTDSFNVLPLNVGPQMFFDAQTTQFTKDGQQQVFKGDVVAVGAGVLITADKISLHRGTMTLIAEGHVIILTEDQVYMGDKVTYKIKAGDFVLINSVMIANDRETVIDVSRRVLGFTPAEVAFEDQKQQRLTVLEERKAMLRNQFLGEVQGGAEEPSQDLVDRYSLLLEQEDLMREQENPFLAKMSKERRRRFKARRFHWEKGIEEARRLRGEQRVTSYFRIDGAKLSRENLNDYKAEDAFWTPCKCDEDDNPAWGFRASEIEAQMEGYVDFYHPVLEIKGIPILYLPYMKVPLKEKRQSGFLMPTFSQRSTAGNIYSQPVYFAVAKNFDATLTADIYEKRGTKLGVEARYQQKKYSGWRLNLAGMRDRVWMEDIKVRREAQDYYFGENDANIEQLCEQQVGNQDVNQIAQCIRAARNRLAAPENLWRGELRWRGLSILAPRLTFVSRGDVYSDHRYVEDLNLYQDFQSALEADTRATYFSTAKYNLNLDAKNFYAGAGGRFGDNVLTTQRYEGQQIPFQFVLQSRFYSLGRGNLPVPVYAMAKAEHYEIRDFVGETENVPQLEGQNRTLGSGYWQRLKFDQVSPLVTNSIIKVDQFSDYEIRGIGHDKLEDPRSSIWSWRGGLTFNLPIDGDAQLPGVFQTDDDNAFGSKFIRHYMNWALTFSIRPEVHRNGPYGQYRGQYYDKGEFREGPNLVYFAGDRTEYLPSDNDILERDTMDPHKIIAFSTSHTWDVFDKGWEKIVGQLPDSPKQDQELTYQQEARRELLLSLDRPIRGYEDMFNLKEEEWYVNRYHLVEADRKRVISFQGDIEYDFEDAETREEQKKQIREGKREDQGQLKLDQPWGEPRGRTSISLFDAKLDNLIRYNIYFRKVVEQRFTLKLPTFFNTSFTLGYLVEDDTDFDPESSSLFSIITKERFVRMNSGIIPHFVLSSWLGRRDRTTTNTEVTNANLGNQYQTLFSVTYISPSECWQLGFQRQKRYAKSEREADYLLQLSILFLGRARATPDVSPGLVRQLPGDRQG